MKKQDAGFRTQDAGVETLDTGSRIQDAALLQRIRWRCRRGLLELDIVFGRFIEVHYAKLSEAERQIFEEFLDMPDNPLWDLISGRENAVSAEQAALLEKIKSL
jgi:antitoxin CptB